LAIELQDLTHEIIGGALEVHKTLGPGLLETAYEQCLCHELSLRGLSFQREIPLPVTYRGVKLDCGYRMDMVVENSVVVELKCVDVLLAVHEAQLLTYLKLGCCKVGLLFNFNEAKLMDGFRRLIL